MSSMRDSMPDTAAFIDSMREAFGAQEMNASMKRGLVDGTFWAVENGHVVGRPQCHLPRGITVACTLPHAHKKGKR